MKSIKVINRLLFLTFLSIPTALGAVEDSLAEAEMLMRSGETGSAVAMLERLESSKPKDGNINMLLGDCYVITGDSGNAIEQYRMAQKKGVNDAWLSLARLATLEYRVVDAEEDIELYRKGLKKGRKTLPDNSEEVVAQLERTQNMLNRVEKIVIIDSLNVDAEDFFTYYRLSPESGTLQSPDILPDNVNPAYPSVVYTTETGMERVFTVTDSEQTFNLASQGKLYGGKWDTPRLLGGNLNEGGDANYPFLMPDGITLYYANDGDNSLGGYDIFVSRKSGLDYLEPQNIGMPYNSPYNDYMLAIDEFTGVGWWATDRNRIPGMVTIYVFIPSDMRVNYDVDDPKLASFARIDRFSDTWEPGKDYSELLRRIKVLSSLKKASDNGDGFMLSVPGRGVLASYDDFRNADARREMKLYMKELSEYNLQCEKLKKLRKRFADGDTIVADDILSLEKQLQTARETLKQTKNRVISFETR